MELHEHCSCIMARTKLPPYFTSLTTTLNIFTLLMKQNSQPTQQLAETYSYNSIWVGIKSVLWVFFFLLSFFLYFSFDNLAFSLGLHSNYSCAMYNIQKRFLQNNRHLINNLSRCLRVLGRFSPNKCVHFK